MIDDFEVYTDKTDKEHLEAVRLLARVGIFSVLSNDQIGDLATQAEVMTCGAGEFIVRQGQQGQALYVISSGECEVFVDDLQAYGTTVATMGKGNFFGEMSLLTGEPVVATVRAMKETVLLSIDKEIFSSILKRHPELSEKLGAILAERQKNYAEVTGKVLKHLPTSRSLVGRIKHFFHI